MCETCGCTVTDANKHEIDNEQDKKTVEVLQSLLHKNNHRAEHNREHFDKHGVLAINLMSSPGSGKTSLLEATIERMKGKRNIAVIEGDLETENDASRIRKKGVPAIQITTGTACHLDAFMVHDALHEMPLQGLDFVFIENVGNLVCPASFDLGHHLNVTLLSVPEGDDKPAKYPVMFRAGNLVLITKADLLPVLDDFSPQLAEEHIRNLANDAPVFNLSVKQEATLDAWINWLEEQLTAYRSALARGETMLPQVRHEGQQMHAREIASGHG